MVTRTREPVTVRFAARRDAQDLERLAQLESRAAPTGPTVVAEVDGQLVAALPLGGGDALADPFQPTADYVRLLERRVGQLRALRRRRARYG